jgi:molybdopterin-guanine dinucleotide biosynthesis adapter protein
MNCIKNAIRRSDIIKKTIPIVSIVGKSGAGKTTLIEKLIPVFKSNGLKVGTIKHDVHGFEMDKPGKDSWRHKRAGAVATIISSPNQIGLVKDVEHDHKPEELLHFLSKMDIILTEGYKDGDKPKIEIFRPNVHQTPLCKNDENLIALVCDEIIDLGVPRFSTNDTNSIVDFVIDSFELI